MIGYSNIAVQGVDYGATIAGYLEGGDPAGASTLAALTNQAASQCPSTQKSSCRGIGKSLKTSSLLLVLTVRSQGAQEVHLGARQISASVASHVKAVVLFGDPDDGQAITNISTGDTVTFCFDTGPYLRWCSDCSACSFELLFGCCASCFVCC